MVEAGWYADPGMPGGQRWWDGQRWTEHTHPASTPPGFAGKPAVGGPVPPSAPEQITSLARALKVLFSIWLVVALITLVNTLRERILLVELRDNPFAVSVADLEASDSRSAALAVLSLLFLLGTGIVFLVWMNKAYKNLRFLGAATLRRGTGWSVGGWFIPFANLVLPYQSMRDIWVGSDPNRVGYEAEWWKSTTSASLVGWWWASWIAWNLLGRAGAATTPSDFAPIEDFLTNNLIYLVSDAFTVVPAVLALRLVAEVTRRQQERARVLGAAV